MPSEEENKKKESAFERTIIDDTIRWQGVIIYSVEQDAFMFMPLEGFPQCEPLASLSNVDLSQLFLSRSDRLNGFDMLLPGETEGDKAYIFLRVEEGGEIENTDAVCNYLDHEMKSSPMVDRLAKYKQMLWSHRCVLFKDFKYMTRSARAPSWQWEDRTVHGVDIRYEHEVVTNGAHRRVRARRPDSVISSMSHAGSVSVADPRDVAQDVEAPVEKGPEKSGQSAAKAAEKREQAEQEKTKEAEKTEAAPAAKESGEKEATQEPTEEETTPPEAGAQTEGQDQVGEEAEKSDDDEDADKYAVTDAEIKAELKNVKVANPLGAKLQALYKELPSRDDYVEPEVDLEKFRDLAARMRPFINAHLIATKQHRLGPLSVKKDWSQQLILKENRRLKEYLDDRDKHEKEMADKKWAAAKKKAETKKRTAVKAQERKQKKKEADAAKKAEKAAAAEAAKAKKAKEAEAKKSKQAEAKKSKEAEAKKRTSGRAAKKTGNDNDPDDDEAAMEEIFADETPGPSTAPISSQVAAALDTGEDPPPESGPDPEPVPEPEAGGSRDPDDNSAASSVESNDPTDSSYVGTIGRDEIMREHGTRSHENTQHISIPPQESRRRSSRGGSAESDPIYLVTQAIRALNETVKRIEDEQKKQNENSTNNMKKIGDAMVLMAKNMDSMKMRLMKKDMETELIVCEAEGRINRLFPLTKLDKAVDLLFTNSRTAKVVAEFICSAIELKNYSNLTISKIVIRAAEVIFSAKLRAFMCLNEPRETDEAQRGWDRQPVPQGFLNIMEQYVFKHFPNAKSTPPSSPLVRHRPWKTVLSGHFGSRREAYFSYLAKDLNNSYEMVVERYAKKLEMHQLHHDPDEQQRIVKVPTLQQELAWYAESVNTTVDGLKTTTIKNKRDNYPDDEGPEFDIDFVNEMINTLTSLHYGVPVFATEFLDIANTTEVVEGDEISAAFEAAKLQRRGLDKYGLSRDDTVHADDVDSDDEVEIPEGQAGTARKRKGDRDDDDDRDAPEAGKNASPQKRARTSRTSGQKK